MDGYNSSYRLVLISLPSHTFLGRVWFPQPHFWFPSPGFWGNQTTCVLLTAPVCYCFVVVFLGLKHCAHKELEGFTIMLQLFHIDLCKYTTNPTSLIAFQWDRFLLVDTDPWRKGASKEWPTRLSAKYGAKKIIPGNKLKGMKLCLVLQLMKVVSTHGGGGGGGGSFTE